jgi:hypothetical protein
MVCKKNKITISIYKLKISIKHIKLNKIPVTRIFFLNRLFVINYVNY